MRMLPTKITHRVNPVFPDMPKGRTLRTEMWPTGQTYKVGTNGGASAERLLFGSSSDWP